MEFIQGLKINQINNEDYNLFAKQIIKFGIVTTIIHGFIHGDLHSGNILFIKKNNCYIIGILDFGIINEINTDFKDILFKIAIGLFNTSPLITANQLLHSGLIEPNNLSEILHIDDFNNILNLTAEIINETITNSKNTNQMQLYKFVTKFNTYLLNNVNIAKFKIKPSDTFVKAQLVIAMTQGIVLMLCKENIISLVDNVINELFHINIAYV
jgi:predicted unusual protein kinase regulating ubiquinone biosynthesis (AarF/ABC1/UbiB family)